MRPTAEGTLSGDTWTTTERYVWEGDGYYDPLVYLVWDNDRYYPMFDGLGSTRQLTDEDEDVTDTYTYEAFGNSMGSTGSTTNPYRYVGSLGYYQIYPPAGGPALMHLGARYYMPEIGRFLSVDPLGVRHPADLQRWTMLAPDVERFGSYASDPSFFEDYPVDEADDTRLALGAAETTSSYAYAANSPPNLVDATGENPALRRALAAAARIAAAAAKRVWGTCKKVRCNIKPEPAHHYFWYWPGKNKMRRHVRVTCWLDKVKGSKFLEIQIPY